MTSLKEGLNNKVLGRKRDGTLANSTAFASWPTGDSLEMMLLDCSLNKDVDDAVKRHVCWTKTIADPDHPAKFDRSSPKKQTAAYLRLLDPSHPPEGGALTSVRIMQDVRRCMGEHLLKISEAHGAVVPKLGSRNGWRAEAARASVGLSANWGGAREKGAAPEDGRRRGATQ